MTGECNPIDIPEHWRIRAEEVRGMADDVGDPDSRRILLDIAADYERLALWVERRLKGLPPERAPR